MREPVLLSQLRTALDHLYFISNSTNRHEAHSYLIDFQSRNVRRKVTSLYQRKRDSDQNDLSTELPADGDTMGSSFYASLPFLLYTTPSHETERLFCAQTILHRLRRMKTSEAIDVEMEFHDSPTMNVNVLAQQVLLNANANNETSHLQYWREFVKFHGEQLSSFHMNLLGKVLQRYFLNWNGAGGGVTSASDLEEKLKGEIALLVLATVSYLNAYAHAASASVVAANGGKEGGSHVGPLLDTLSSAMALVALRLRHTSASVASNTVASSTPIVTLIVQAFQSVLEFASTQYHHDLLPGVIVGDESMSQFLHQQNGTLHQRALSECLCVALASIPDAILGSPGGARGRLSVDPKCIMATNAELRCEVTGVGLLKEVIVRLMEGSSGDQQGSLYMQHQVLIASERWARFVPLPLDFVQYTLSTAISNISNGISPGAELSSFEKTFCAYLIRIYESACMSVDQIIASAAGLSAESSSASHQLGRKKQSSKSKKRHQERLEEVVNGDNLKRQEAEREVYTRGVAAVHTAMWTWDGMNGLFLKTLEVMSASPDGVVEGEGPVGLICACVSACLPHFIRHGPISEDASHSTALFGLVVEALKMICSNDNVSVRALAFEHIVAVHKALAQNSKSANLNDVEVMAIQSICECSFILSNKCAYPVGYFMNLARNNDEALEIERNDVRDVLRAVSSLEDCGDQLPHVSLIILDRIVQHCAEGVSEHNAESLLPPETIIHTLSAPAKSLQRMAQTLQDHSDSNRPLAEKIINSALDCLTTYCGKLLEAFSQSLPMAETLPVSRLICLTVASFTPFFAIMAKAIHSLQDNLRVKVQRAIGLAILAIAASITNIPELIAASTLDNTRYDIRGAMRAPGGEDHCGCIALMRIVKAGEQLTLASLEYAALASSASIISTYIELAKVYAGLHRAETERPPGQIHGSGVTPKSRRDYLTSMTKIGLVTMKAHPDTSEQISSELKALFHKPVDVILSCNQRSELTDAQKIFLLCEACFDLSAFPPLFCKELFVANGYGTRATEILIEACASGFSHATNEEPSESIVQVSVFSQ